MTIRNNVWRAHRDGRTAIGMSVKAPSARIVELAAAAELDFVRFDLTAGSVPLEALPGLIDVCVERGITPLVRVETSTQISAVFAAGVYGITLPNVANASDAEAFGAVCANEGSHLGDQLLTSVQIESINVLEHLVSIATIPSIHMLQSGRNDLAKSLGLKGQPNHRSVLEIEERIANAASDAGKLLSLHFAPGPESVQQAQAWLHRNIDCLTIGADTQILGAAIAQRLSLIRQPLAQPASSGTSRPQSIPL